MPRRQRDSTKAARCAIRIAVVGLAAFLTLSAAPCLARVAPSCACMRPQDEIWHVSSRAMNTHCMPCGMCRPQLCYQQFGQCRVCGCSRWVGRDECDFWNTASPDKITVVIVHGNRLSDEAARQRGLDLYNGLVRCRCDGRSIRVVLWSWPSDSIPNRLAAKRDARVKFRRIPREAYYLAWWLNHFSSDHQISLVGYSYGGAVMLGSLHMLGGGQLECRSLPRCQPPPQLRIAIWAPATQSNWLVPGGPHGCALCCLESGTIFVNRCDPALKRFRRVIFAATGPALGYVGLTDPQCCYPGYDRIRQFDATRCIGKHHNWDHFRRSTCIMNETRRVALWESN